ncbi:MAG: formyl transferase [Ginsengibacter sp.]
MVFEEAENPDILYKKRVKKIGALKVWGQKLFDKHIPQRLLKTSIPRIQEIIKQQKLISSKIPEDKKKFVKSINDTSTIHLIKLVKPDIVIVNATRILKPALLNSIEGHFINIHSGMLPKYRGYSGGYWALVCNDKNNCGSTIHFINDKIDTGAILYRDTVKVNSDDNYMTYGFLHVAKEIELLKKAIISIADKNYKLIKNDGNYRIRYGPTLWGYLFNKWIKNIK